MRSRPPGSKTATPARLAATAQSGSDPGLPMSLWGRLRGKRRKQPLLVSGNRTPAVGRPGSVPILRRRGSAAAGLGVRQTTMGSSKKHRGEKEAAGTTAAASTGGATEQPPRHREHKKHKHRSSGGGSSGGERRKRSRERGSERGSGRRGAENDARSSTHGRERSQTEPSERRVKREKRDDGYEAGEGPVQGAGRPEVPRVCGLWVWRPSAPGRGILWLFRQHFLKGLPMAIWD